MNVLSAIAPAKLNLYLHVIGKNPAGTHREHYHLLESLVTFVNVHDSVEVTTAPSLSITVKGDYAYLVPDNDNIVYKTAVAIQRYFHVTKGAAITLYKNLPVGAGIGGGSADAAATMKLLLRVWKIDATQEDVTAIALSLGADVPACLRACALYMSGIGEVLKPAPLLAKCHVLLINPGKPLLTNTVFSHFHEHFSKPMTPPEQFSSRDNFFAFLRSTRNDLENTAISLMPEIGTILQELKSDPECKLARMSGSGATCFGLFTRRLPMENTAIRISKQYPKWWIRSTGFL